MAIVGEVKAILTGDSSGLESAVKRATGALGTIGGAAEDAGRRAVGGFSRLQAGIVTLNQSFQLLSGIAHGMVSALDRIANAVNEQERATALLNNTLRSTGQFTLEYSRQLHELSSAFALVTTSSDETILNVERQLVLYGATRANIGQLTATVLDLSEVMGKDLSGATLALGAVLQGNFAPITRQLKIHLDENATATEKWRVIQEHLTRTQGAAGAAAATFGGRLTQLRNALGEIVEESAAIITQSEGGKAALIALRDAALGIATGIAKWTAANRELIDQRIGTFVSDLPGSLDHAATSMARLAEATAGWAEDIGKVVGWLGSHPALASMMAGGAAGAAVGGVPGAVIGAGIGGVLSDADVRARLGALTEDRTALRRRLGINPQAEFPTAADVVALHGGLRARGAATAGPAVPPIGIGGAPQIVFPEQIDTTKALTAEADKQKAIYAAQRQRLDAVVAAQELELQLAQATGASSAMQVRLIEEIRAGRLAALDVAEQGLHLEQQSLIQAQSGSQDLEHQKKTEAEIGVIAERLLALDSARQQVVVETTLDILKQRDALHDAAQLEARTATARAEAAAGVATERLSRAGSLDAATNTELQTLARTADAAEIAALEQRREELEKTQQLLVEDGAAINDLGRAKLDALTQQIEAVNAQLALGPTRIRELNKEWVNVGQTLNGLAPDVVTGIATGQVDPATIGGRRLGEAFIGEMVRSTFQAKHVFDFKMKANLLEYLPGLGKEGGAATGLAFAGGLTDSAGTLVAAAGTPAVDQLTGTLAAQGLTASAGAEVLGPSTAANQAATGAAAGAGASLGGPILLAATLGATTALSAVQTLRSGSPGDQAETARELAGILPSVGLGSIGFGINQLFGFKGTTARVIAGISSLGMTEALQGISDAFGLKGFFGIGQAPTSENVVGKAAKSALAKAGIPWSEIGLAGRSLADLSTGREAGRRDVKKILEGSTAPEQYRDEAINLGNLLAGTEKGAGWALGNTLINNARALGETAEETRQNLLDLASSLNLDLASGIKQANTQLLEGTTTLQGYNAEATALFSLLGSPDVRAIDMAAILGISTSSGSRINATAVQKFIDDARRVITAGSGSFVDALIGGGSTRDAMGAFAVEAGQTFVERFKEQLLQGDVFGAFVTKGSAELTKAAELYAAGDTAGAAALARLGIADLKMGAKQFAEFWNSGVGRGVTGTFNTLTGTSATLSPGVIDQLGAGLPTFDTGGVMPGSRGAPGLAVLHGGETVSTPAQMTALVSSLRDAILSGRHVTINWPDYIPAYIAPAEVSRSLADDTRLQRTRRTAVDTGVRR